MRKVNFFEDIKDLKEVAPGLDSNSLTTLLPAYERASIKIKKVITDTVWAQLLAAYVKNTDSDTETNPTEEETTAIEFIQGALGNLIAFHDVMFKVISKKQENQSYYKYELQMIRESYLDNFSIYMDLLLDYLDLKAPVSVPEEGEEAEASKFPTWVDSDTYKMRQSLILKNADDFNSVFPTGGSSYFFSMIVPLQNQVIESELIPRKALADMPSELAKTVKYFVAYRTMAKAAMLVDYADLPQSLRQKLYVDESKKKHQETETTAERYANQFNKEADSYLNKIDLKLQKPAADVVSVPTQYNSVNEETDQSFVIT